MDVRLPNLGEGADSGSVVNLFVKEGDEIKKGDTLLELENEKAVAPIPSPADGRVSKIKVKEGDKISVGQVILSLAKSGAAEEADPEEEADQEEAEPRSRKEPAAAPAAEEVDEQEIEEEPGDTEEPPPPASGEEPAASPSVRKICRDLGIDLRRVQPSARGGRVVLADVRHYVQRLQKAAFQAKKAAPAAKQVQPILPDFAKWGPIEKKNASSLRLTISRRMLESWNTIPHVTQFDEADITDLMQVRKKYAPDYEKAGAKLTLTSFALQAAVSTLQKHPLFNASFDELGEEIILKHYFHIGLAVDTEAGLIVPVIRDVDKKTLFDLSADIAQIAEKARDRKLSGDDLKGGSFTISNQGGIGGAHFTPIVNRPEVAILGLGRGILKPALHQDKIQPRLMLPLCVSYDHRLIDGAQAARFIKDLIAALESFKEADIKLPKAS